ncbi:MAG: TonB-dependent receptor [Azoarcus sp.]|jgi:vitamin B12 transporter|nr:TonB-dependent receptor [Azoarcus sp.]
MPIHKKLLASLCLAAIAAPIPSFAQNAIDVAELDTVVVTATRQETRASDVLADVTVIDREEIGRSGQETIVDLLARQPGIQVNTSGGAGTASSFYIRGANSDQTKVLVDGIPINSVDLSGSPLRFMPLGDVERIEILRGPAATLYGADAIGGVIHIITRRGKPGLRAEASAGYGSHATRKATAGLSGGDEHWRFHVAANHYATDGISAQRHATNKDADDDAYRNTGGAVSLSFLPAEKHEFGLSYRENRGMVHYDSGNVPPYGTPNGVDDYRSRFDTRQWQLFSKNRFFSDRWTSTLQYGEAVDDEKSYGAGGDRSKLFTRNRQLTWQNDIELPLGKLILAGERLRQNAGPKADYQTSHMTNDAFMAGWMARLGDHDWQVNARSDHHSEFGRENTYSLAYGYRIAPEWRARIGYGTAFKAPSLYQLYTKSWGYGNPDIKPEKARNREAALIWERGPHTASLTVYRNKVKDLISSNPITWQADNISRAKLSGATLAYSGIFDGWRLGAAYDRLDARNDDTGRRLGRRARDSAIFNLAREWGKFNVGTEIVAVGKRYDNHTESETLGGYVLANLTASYALTPELRIESRLNNLFNKKYETVRYYNTGGFNAFIGLHYSPQ